MSNLTSRSAWIIMLLVVVAALTTGCKDGNLVSTSDEVEIGRQAAADVERQYRIVQDPALNRRVNQIGQTLAARAPRPGITYTFKIIDSPEVNAFSLPGGWIYVTTGLLNAVGNNDNMLAGVIGHEIGHVAAKHHAQMITRQQVYGIAIGTLTKGSVSDVAAIFANLNLLHWSRKDEYESDRLALQYTYNSPYNPEGLIQFFQLLQRQGKESRFASFLRTHPLTEDRIARAQQMLAKLRAGQSI